MNPTPAAEAGLQHSVGYNLVWGAMYGVRVGFFFVVLATVTRAFGGADLFRSWQSTYLREVITDLSGGLAGGLVVGFLRPRITSAKAAALVGFLALLPIALLVNWEDHRLLGVADGMYSVLIYAVGVGSVAGALMWFRVQNRMRLNKH